MNTWIVEARTFGETPSFYRYGPVSKIETKRLHAELSNSGEWPFIRSWSLEAEVFLQNNTK